MKKMLCTVVFIAITAQITAQNYKFGKVSEEELKETVYEKDSSANAVVLYKKRSSYYSYDQAGFNIVTDVQMRIKIYNSEGFDWATNSISLGGSESVSGLKAYTFNLENEKVASTKLEKKDIFVENTTKTRKRHKFTMPNLKEGCVIEWKYRLKSGYTGSMSDMVLQYSIPIKKIESSVSLLEYFIFNKRTKGYVNFHLNQERKNNTSLGTSDIYLTVSEDHIPALKEEAYVSNINDYRAGVVFEIAGVNVPGKVYENYATNWDEVTKTIYDSPSFGTELGKKSFLKDHIEVLQEKYKSENEKIIGAFDFVKSKVKWNGNYSKYAGKGLRNALKEGTGNSGQVNLLLVSVLRQLGLNANPVLLSTRKNGIPLLPTTSGLNYVIAAVELESGMVLLDATDEFSSPNVLPLRAINWQGRLIRENGSSKWVDLTPDNKASSTISTQVTIDEDGFVEGMRRSQLTNYAALSYRSKYANLDDEEITSKVEGVFSQIEIDQFRISNKKNQYKPIVEMYKFESEEMVEMIGDKIYFEPMLLDTENENPFKLEERVYPIDFGTPIGEKNVVSVTIPEGYKVEFKPEDIAIGLPDNLGVFRFSVTVQANKINIISIFNINVAKYPIQYYPDIKEFYKIMINKNLEKIVLSKA